MLIAVVSLLAPASPICLYPPAVFSYPFSPILQFGIPLWLDNHLATAEHPDGRIRPWLYPLSRAAKKQAMSPCARPDVVVALELWSWLMDATVTTVAERA